MPRASLTFELTVELEVSVPDRPSAEIEEFVRIAHEVVCLYCVPRQNRRCLTKFVPVPRVSPSSHLFHVKTARVSPISHLSQKLLNLFDPSGLAALLRRSSTLKAHAFPTRPTDNLTFATSKSQIPTTADQPRTVLACWCISLSHCYSQAIPSPSHSCPLDSISQPSPSLSAHLGFPTRSLARS